MPVHTWLQDKVGDNKLPNSSGISETILQIHSKLMFQFNAEKANLMRWSRYGCHQLIACLGLTNTSIEEQYRQIKREDVLFLNFHIHFFCVFLCCSFLIIVSMWLWYFVLYSLCMTLSFILTFSLSVFRLYQLMALYKIPSIGKLIRVF